VKDERLAPVIYLSHGGGPLPLLGDERHQAMVGVLKEIAGNLLRPTAIVLVSAHWEAACPTVTGGARPPLIYDYYGFPEASYTLTYPAPGEPKLAERIVSMLNAQKIPATLDEHRGFDHGMFVPLKIMFPDAEIPCVQLSLINTLNPSEHIAMGKALAALRRENVLIIGSGFSFHNLKAFFSANDADTRRKNLAFDAWLQHLCLDEKLSEVAREEGLIHWDSAPAARFCHPREEHLLPLHVCYGAALRAATRIYDFDIMNIKASVVVWVD